MDLELNQQNSNLEIEKEQKAFLESGIGKVINTAMDMGIRFLLPDFIENEVIEIKDTLVQEGFQEGIDKTIENAVDLGKSAIGIVTGEFENISQVQAAVEKGGIIETLSNVIDTVLDKCSQNNLLSPNIVNVIKQGKNIILDNVSSNIENMMTEQIKSVETIQTLSNNWRSYYMQKNFDGMEKEMQKLEKEMKKIIPLENLIKGAREIQNMHQLIKNNGQVFELTENQINAIKALAK
ncbi:MAG TPA: hypothetical protein IAB70_07155 [Candidatus Merdicola faecigallinarum]|uniref:Uncharacterized protein n=1 Tax=Candidatus Merdicola faecigallinarum TaxID=2840862 RepID=A0A9D1M2A9_9FIRM|nr:hypothetical protein [Candidatus Merdicola faecigallinarum]